jgi:cellulose biosynthesis protein BcsQ
VLIDTPPAVDHHMIYAASSADMIVVPTRTSILDQFALRETLEYLRRMNVLHKAAVVINAPGADAAARKDTERIAEREFAVPLVCAALPDLSELAKALREGKGVTEAGARTKAAKALRDVYRELAGLDRQLIKSQSRVST